ncbi:MAG: hypothetical protein PF961_13735 [Planctomycetota bacterium]|jgi:hypothetical protein|nr:hypothetical protein [Planctomycetota bacterium]
MTTLKTSAIAPVITEHRDHLLKGLHQTLTQSMLLDAPGPNGGGEDEANYALPWLLLHLLTGDHEAATHAHDLFTDLQRWVAEHCIDGYEADAEAHHGTEPFLLFLPRYAKLFDSQAARDLITNAADFIIGRKPGAPQWYDSQREVFVSWDLGARYADRDPKHRKEYGDHWRFIHIALAAYDCSGDEAYAAWALAYAKARARRIVAAADPLPAEWTLDGDPIPFTDQQRMHTVTNDPLTGVESILASGGLHALADCFAIEADPVLQHAAHRVAGHLVPLLTDPYCDPAAAALRRYRLGFADNCFDQAITEQAGAIDLRDAPEHLVLPARIHRADHGTGVGRRKDMQRWYIEDDTGALQPSAAMCPAAATLAWDVTGDPRFAEHALRLAAQRTWIAQRALRSGREHADKGCSIASVLTGHGRNWGTGAATGCLQPLLRGGDVIRGSLAPALSIKADSALCTLVQSDPTGERVHGWNTGTTAVELSIQGRREHRTLVAPGHYLIC